MTKTALRWHAEHIAGNLALDILPTTTKRYLERDYGAEFVAECFRPLDVDKLLDTYRSLCTVAAGTSGPAPQRLDVEIIDRAGGSRVVVADDSVTAEHVDYALLCLAGQHALMTRYCAELAVRFVALHRMRERARRVTESVGAEAV